MDLKNSKPSLNEQESLVESGETGKVCAKCSGM